MDQVGERLILRERVSGTVDADDVRKATAWNLRIAADLAVTEPPSDAELTALRSLRTKGSPA